MTDPQPDPRIPAAFRSASAEAPHAPLGSDAPPATVLADPLKLCVATTVAVIAWLATPPVAVAVFAGVALVAYARARRGGLLASRCALGDTRLVMAYLALTCAAGVAGTVRMVVG